jgi:endogenous inhibitor of DNA gyrase (YacG/DUF329 family)
VPPVKKVACPVCGKLAAYSPENKSRPFCSERCKTIDLGDWASERYRVAAEEPEERSAEADGKSDDAA